MSTENSIIELAERYVNGQMLPDEQREFELKVQNNAYLAKIVNEFVLLHETMATYATRYSLKSVMNQWHNNIELPEAKLIETETVTTKAEVETKKQELPVQHEPVKVISFYQRNKKHFAVAASVALFSVLSTIGISSYLNSKKTRAYTELKKEIDNIKKSQKVLANQINITHPKGSKIADKKIAAAAKFGGTGFLLTPDGYIVTSLHLVQDAKQLQVVNNGFGYDVDVVQSDKTCDMALLKIRDSSFETYSGVPYRLYSGLAQMGQTVFTLGYPRADLVFGEGSISALTGYNDDTASYQISVPLNPGNSGGPLFDQYGNIVGIISGKQSRTDAAAFAIKSNYVLEMINKVEPGALNFQVSKKYRVNLARMGRVQQVETLKPYIFEVRVIN